MPATVATTELQVSRPPAGKSFSTIATVGVAATTLGAACAGGIPKWSLTGSTTETNYPTGVILEVSPGSTGALVRCTLDGNTDPSVVSGAEAGIPIPEGTYQPIACKELIQSEAEGGTRRLRLISGTALTKLIVTWTWNPAA